MNEWARQYELSQLLGGAQQSGFGTYASGANFIMRWQQQAAQQMTVQQTGSIHEYPPPAPPTQPRACPNMDWLDKRVDEMRVKL